jgi:NADH-quinone oxidoreductase subunit F
MNKSIIVTMGTCGISAGSKKVSEALFERIKGLTGMPNVTVANVKTTSCMGLCSFEPTVIVENDDNVFVLSYVGPDKEDIDALLEMYQNFYVPERFKDRLIYSGKKSEIFEGLFKGQKRIVLRNAGWIDPFNIEDYISNGGYKFLQECIFGKHSPEYVLSILKESGLRGRGGAGFPTALKWEMLANNISKEKYVICNGDEGDPGAFMDRAVLEGDPHSVLEGLQLACFVTGAVKCFIYVRAEYPLAVKTLKNAIASAEQKGFLSFPVEVMEGAGAFVCGEETALIASIEGKRGMPRLRPPYPAESGLWGKPTIINNVETLAAVPWIVNNPGEYQKIGFEKSKGTKVFALAGKIKKGGLAEVPFGISLRELIFEVGGGIQNDRSFKAVQIGGPSGGCLPDSKLDVLVDYEALKESGVIVGSGGLVVMDETSCMVDIARFFLSFTSKESCGKCTFCRIGTTRLLDILNRISKGKALADDMDKLKELAQAVSKLSLCGLGQTAPNPVLTTLKYFAEEYSEHINNKHCPAGVCKSLITYNIDPAKCVGCMLCKKACPVSAVYEVKVQDGEEQQPSAGNKKRCDIDQAKCIKCGKCYEACKFDAVSVK